MNISPFWLCISSRQKKCSLEQRKKWILRVSSKYSSLTRLKTPDSTFVDRFRFHHFHHITSGALQGSLESFYVTGITVIHHWHLWHPWHPSITLAERWSHRSFQSSDYEFIYRKCLKFHSFANVSPISVLWVAVVRLQQKNNVNLVAAA